MSLGLLKGNVSPIAVDFGVASMKALQIAPGDPPTVIGAAEFMTPDELLDKPDERMTRQLSELPRIIKSGRFRGRRVVCAVSAASTLAQHIFVPKGADAAPEGYVRTHLAQWLNRDPSQIILRHDTVCDDVLRAGSKGSEVIGIAMPRELVIKTITTLRKSRFETVGVHDEHHAMLRCFESTEDADAPDGASMYVDMGYVTTKVVVAYDRRFAVVRTLPFGGKDIDAAVSHNTRISLEEARRNRIGGGNPEDSSSASKPLICDAPAAQNTDPDESGVRTAPAEESPAQRVATVLHDELDLCARYFSAIWPGRTISRIVFAGGEARNRDTCRELARGLGIRALVADPFSGLAGTDAHTKSGVDLTSPQPGWIVPMGLCAAPADL